MKQCRLETASRYLIAAATALLGVAYADTVFAPDTFRLVPRNGGRDVNHWACG